MTAQQQPFLPECLPARMAGDQVFGMESSSGIAKTGISDAALFGSSAGPVRPTSVGLASILRQKWLMLGVFLLVCVGAVPPVWLLVSPTYASRAVVRVSPIVSRLVYQTDQNGVVPFYESYLNTQVSVIRSPTVLQRLVDREAVRKSHWYLQQGQSFSGQATAPVERLSEALSVQPRPRTHLIDVSMSTERAEDAKLIVDAAVDEYLKYVEEISRDEETMLLETLRKEQKTREDRIKGYRQTRDMLTERPGLFNSEQLRATLGSQLSLLESRRAELQREVVLTSWKIDRLAPASRPASAPAMTSAPAVSAGDGSRLFARDPEWRQLNAENEQARHALAVAKLTYGESHYRLKELAGTSEYAERMLRQRETELMETPLGMSASQPASPHLSVLPEFQDPRILTELVAARRKEIELLDRDIEEQRGKAGTAQELSRMEDLIKHEEEVYNDVSKRLSMMEMESKTPARIEIVAHGLAPSRPSKDRRLLMALMAVCAAAGLALGVGYLRAMSDPRIRELGEVMHVTQVPFLGQLSEFSPRELPLILGGDRNRNAAGDVFALASCPVPLVEGMRMIRTALLDRLGATGPHVLLITSPVPRSGKTSFAIMLAGSLSLVGKKVLVVEVDLYRPSLARRLGLQSKRGLTHLLKGVAADEEVITQSCTLPFHVVLAGESCSEDDPELLADGVFSKCLTRWGATYDIILLDGPPVLAVADSRILARHCEGSVMVMRASHDTRAEAVEAYAALADCGRAVLGTVLIGGQSRTGRGYRGEYYEYVRRDYKGQNATEAESPVA